MLSAMQPSKHKWTTLICLLGFALIAACADLSPEEDWPPVVEEDVAGPAGSSSQVAGKASTGEESVELDAFLLARPIPYPEYCTPNSQCSTQGDCGVTECYTCQQVCVYWHSNGTCCEYETQCTTYPCYAGVCHNGNCLCY